MRADVDRDSGRVASAFGLRWDDVKNLGRVHSERLRSGATRHRIVFHVKGKQIKVSRQAHDNGVEVPFPTREAAEFVLQGIRSLVAQGLTLQRAIAKYRPMDCPEDLVENRVGEYLAHFRELVEQGKRSPTTFREIERYAKTEGSGSAGGFSYWYGRNTRNLSNGDVEDWHKWLGGRRISPKAQKLVSDAFRAFLRRLEWRNEVYRVPQFPTIEVPEYAPRIITADRQAEILNAIPRGNGGAPSCVRPAKHSG